MDEYFYEVDLSWKSEKTGILSSHGLKEIEMIAHHETPRGKKNSWTPEHLLAAALSSCFMTCFLETAEHAKLEIIGYRSQSLVKLEKIHGKFSTTEILLRPVIKLGHEGNMLKAYKCIEEAEEKCPIKNALKIIVDIHPQFEYLNKGIKIKL